MTRLLFYDVSRSFLILTVVLVAAGCQQDIDPDLAVRNVNIVDIVNGRIIENATIAISGSRIVSIHPDETSDGVAPTIVDGSGMFAIPGLWDMHVHALWDSTAATDLLPLFIASGITGIRDMGGMLTVRHYADSLIASGDLVSPHIISPGPVLDGPIPIDPSIGEAVVDSAAAASVVDSLAAGGVDFIKVYTLLPRDAFFGVIKAANEYGLDVVGHLPIEISLSDAINAGMASIEHLNEGVEFICQPGNCMEAGASLSNADVYQTPTLSIIQSKADVGSGSQALDERLQFMPDYLVEMWRDQASRSVDESRLAQRREHARVSRLVTGELHNAGVSILAGTDAGDLYSMHGFSLADELSLLVTSGLSERDALAAATLNAAQFLGQEDERGVIAPEAIADIVLLRSNPLIDIDAVRHVESVILGGEFFNRAALDSLRSLARQ